MSETLFDFIQAETRRHRDAHDCGAYTFGDGAGLIELAQAHQATRVLELGTALGYTACCLASASANGHVDTIELDPEHVRIARDHVVKAGLSGRVTVHHGDFTAVAQTLPENYDLAFFDGFAPEPSLLELLREKLRDGGLLVCANLQFASAKGRALLSDSKRWEPAGSVEGGATQVFVKRGT